MHVLRSIKDLEEWLHTKDTPNHRPQDPSGAYVFDAQIHSFEGWRRVGQSTMILLEIAMSNAQGPRQIAPKVRVSHNRLR